VLRSVAILYHPRRERAVEEARWLEAELGRRGVKTTCGDGWDAVEVQKVCCAKDLVVIFGGDGTILRVTRFAAPHGVPVLGINLGRVGFLAEMTPEGLRARIDEVVEGRFWTEQRTMLDVERSARQTNDRFLCVNEVVVARGVAPRAIHVQIMLDGEEFMTYTADGLLVATATGSTAYSLAAGGPILYPESRDFMLTPVAPHLHIGRSMIVPGNTSVQLTLATDRPAVISVDGTEEHSLHVGDQIHVRRSELTASFARLGPRRYFYTAIADRLK